MLYITYIHIHNIYIYVYIHMSFINGGFHEFSKNKLGVVGWYVHTDDCWDELLPAFHLFPAGFYRTKRRE